jgi:aspartyl-tRNA(Asn)/glutamyl-tRNA(Gln) amidotransferase subunit A
VLFRSPKVTDEWNWPFPARFYSGYTNFANLCGLPAISVPAGLVDGLPTGLQIIGRARSEATLLRVARALEKAQPWPLPRVGANPQPSGN